MIDHAYHARIREASQLASEAMALLESIGDPNLTVGLSVAGDLRQAGKRRVFDDVLRWSQRVIDLADGDPSKGDFLSGLRLAYRLSHRGPLPGIAWVVPDGATTCATA